MRGWRSHCAAMDCADVREPHLTLRLLAPAKINLHLRVGSPAPDGFHPLLSWMCTVALFDTIHMSRAVGDGGSATHSLVTLSCDEPTVPRDETNLIVKVAAELASAASSNYGGKAGRPTSPSAREGRDANASAHVGGAGASRSLAPDAAVAKAAHAEARLSSIKVSLAKRIPAGAGLGGGSSDGARAMQGFARLWGLDAAHGFGRDRLAELSARCGSDLPFFFHGPSSACSGRGQFVRPVLPPSVARWAVIIMPAMAMPTPAVYRTFDEMRLGDSDRLAAEPDWNAWAQLSSDRLLPLLANDLEAPAFALRPELQSLRSAIELQLGRIVRMSGSGSSLFTLFDGEPAAQRAASRVTESFGVRCVAVEVAPRLGDDLGQ